MQQRKIRNMFFFFFLTIRLHSVESWVVFSVVLSLPVCYLVTLLVFFFSFCFLLLPFSIFIFVFSFFLASCFFIIIIIFRSVWIFKETVVFAECVYYACLSAILLLRSQWSRKAILAWIFEFIIVFQLDCSIIDAPVTYNELIV